MASRSTNFVYRMLKVIMSIVILFPATSLSGAEPAAAQQGIPARRSKRRVVVDVELTPESAVRGVVVNGQGQQLPHVDIEILRRGNPQNRTKTDENGRFAVAPLKTGQHQLVVLGSPVWCRFWKSGTAPPHASQELLLVAGDAVHRAQREFGSLIHSDKLLIALILAGAIAIPIAISSQSNNPARPAS